MVADVFSLRGSTAIVTGSSRSLGVAKSEVFAAEPYADATVKAVENVGLSRSERPLEANAERVIRLNC